METPLSPPLPLGSSLQLCRTCNHERPITGFRLGRSSCKACAAVAVKAYRHAHPEKIREQDRRRYATRPARKHGAHLRARYGITHAEFAAMHAEQEGKCLICKQPEEQRLCVDHDHATGAVRGLLCAKCNRMLGCALDSPAILRAAIEYLARSSRRSPPASSPPASTPDQEPA